MPGLMDVAEMIASIGVAAKMSAASLKEASAEQDRFVAGMSKNQGGTGGVNALGSETTALGSPGNAEDMAARMVAAIDKATRGR